MIIGWLFRSTDPMVMSHVRFLCANPILLWRILVPFWFLIRKLLKVCCVDPITYYKDKLSLSSFKYNIYLAYLKNYINDNNVII